MIAKDTAGAALHPPATATGTEASPEVAATAEKPRGVAKPKGNPTTRLTQVAGSAREVPQAPDHMARGESELLMTTCVWSVNTPPSDLLMTVDLVSAA
mmetsp:Transcript_44867/g.104822  ORF Transcript_44867/g.104822 Transcript_44867/m.104822 type:complete len:98 (-) Transcript_44867:69-362(-)